MHQPEVTTYLARNNQLARFPATPAESFTQKHYGLLPVSFLKERAHEITARNDVVFHATDDLLSRYRFVSPYRYSTYDDKGRYIVLESNADMTRWEFHIDPLTARPKAA